MPARHATNPHKNDKLLQVMAGGPARITTKKASPDKLFDKLIFESTIITILVLSVFNVFIYKTRKSEVITINTTINDVSFWEEVLEDHPTYRDGYLALAQLKLLKGDVRGADSFFKKAKNVDPFFIP